MRARITKITNTQAEPMRRLEILAQYHEIFNALNRRYFNNELPEITIDYRNDITEDCTAAFTYDTEKATPPKIILQIQEGPEYGINTDTVNDLYHELIHYYCYLHGIKDTTGADHDYHNYNFKMTAEAHGSYCKWSDLKNGFNQAYLLQQEAQEILDIPAAADALYKLYHQDTQ